MESVPVDLDSTWVRRLEFVGRTLCVLTFVGGLTVLAGWMLGLPLLPTLFPEAEPSKPATALGLIAAALACWLVTQGSAPTRVRTVAAQLLSAIVILIGATALVEILTGRDIGMGAFFVRHVLSSSAQLGLLRPMSSGAALSFVLLGAAFLWLNDRGKSARPVQLAALLILLGAVVPIAGYVYDSVAVRTTPVVGTTALPTALGFLTMSASLIAARPTEGLAAVIVSTGAGGTFARRSIVSIVLVPFVLNWVEMAGELAGWYPERTGWMVDTGITVVSLLGLTWWVAATLRIRDVERQQLTNALRESEERYRTLVEMAPDAIVLKNQRRIEFANAAALRLVGASRLDEVVGRSPFAFVHPEERSNIEVQVCALLERGERMPLVEHRLLRSDGTPLDVEATASAIDVGGRRLAQVVLRDVSQRKKDERALRESVLRFELATRATHDAVWDFNVQTGAAWWSDVWYDKYGYSRSTIPTLDAWADHIHPDDYDRVTQSFTRALEGPDDQWSEEYRYRCGNGSYAHVIDRACFVRDAESRAAVRATGVLEDVTERMAMQAQLAQAQKMEAIGQLAGGVAHDFNNLLTVIHGYASLLAQSSAPRSPMKDDVNEIVRAAERAAGLTRQLLAFSRKQILEPRVLRLGDAIEEITPMLRRLLRESITIRTARRDHAHVTVDPGQISQVVMNLAVNASDAMPGGGALVIETADEVLDDDYARHHASVQPGRYVMLAVSDTGHGMDAATQARIFEPFFTTKPVGYGTGLGLAMVHGVVKQTGGSIWVYSEVGRGTTFKVYFPATAAPVDAPRPRRAADAMLTRGTETVLLVEDEKAVRSFVATVLRKAGYTVHPFGDPREAIEFTQGKTAALDLVVTDVVLPGMSGKVVAEAAREAHAGCQVLYMSGYTNDAIVHSGVLDASVSLVHKPFTSDILLQKVRSVLDAR